MDYTSVPNFMKIRRGQDFLLLIWHGMTHIKISTLDNIQLIKAHDLSLLSDL